jgi:hypothetical protein
MGRPNTATLDRLFRGLRLGSCAIYARYAAAFVHPFLSGTTRFEDNDGTPFANAVRAVAAIEIPANAEAGIAFGAPRLAIAGVYTATAGA